MARRSYTLAEKTAAVAEAERTNVLRASESTGIPRKTLEYWYHDEEFASLRQKTRDDLADGSIVLAMLAQGELVRRIRLGKLSDQALVAAFGVGIDKAQLLSGMATARTENRDITGSLSDLDIRAAVREAQDLARGGAGGAPEAAPGTPEG